MLRDSRYRAIGLAFAACALFIVDTAPSHAAPGASVIEEVVVEAPPISRTLG